MRMWDAFSNVMRTSRNHRIGSDEAEQLLSADPGAPAYPELTHLLAAAAAPPRSDELVDLPAAVAAFEAAGQNGEPNVAVTRRRRLFARSVVVKAVAGVALVLFGGTAVAAETGNLPSGAQRHAHDVFSVLGVPPPAATSSPAQSPAPSPAGHVTPTVAPGAGAEATTPQPTSAAAPGLCRSWQARQKNPKNKPMKAEALRALAAAAGGAEHIAAYCAAVLAGSPGSTATAGPTTAAATPSHPGNGKGHIRTPPTPNPHKKE